MDEEKDNLQNQDQNNENEVLIGQMGYEELLINLKQQEEKQEKDEKEIVLDGQVNLFDLKQTFEEEKQEKKESAKTSSKKQNVEKEFEEENQEEQNQIKPAKKRQDMKKEKNTMENNLNGNGGKTPSILFKSIDEVLHSSMIPYTEHVVLDRALPRVEDGLKPVQRRILYSMLELGLEPDKPYRKSARIVGDCMGKYHPHGDSSVYDAMVRMSQDFSLREPLVKGHGNFGSIDGDSAAAMRYTEAKLTPLAMELLKDLEKNTVKWSLNFDDTLKEPDMLPGGFPNLLVNGAAGIAVGVATNIPPHSLSEVIDGTVAYIENNSITLDEMMKIIPAPDFPTGGLIIASDELKQAYETGKGKIVLRAKAQIENDGDKKQIVITELPYQVNKASLLKKIADLKGEQKDKLSSIGEIRDESDRNGLRAVIKLKKDANAHAILEYLYKSTQAQVTFGINMVAIAGGRPKQLGLLEIISYYVEYRRGVIYNRTEFDLNIAKDRAHIVEGLLVAIANIDEVIKIIKRSQNVADAKEALSKKFNLSDKQTQAILDMRLARLVNLEIVKLEAELKELKEKIKKFEEILASKRKQYNLVKSELLEVKKQFGSERKSKIIYVQDVKEATEMSEDYEEEAFAKEVVIGVTAGKTLKQIPIKNYALSQKEIAKSSQLTDVHTTLFKTMSNQNLLLFTNQGNCIKINAGEIPEAKWRDKGTTLADFVKNAAIDEFVVAICENNEENLKNKLFVFTKQGFTKQMAFEEVLISKNYYSIIKLKEGDELINVQLDTDAPTVVMVSQNGNALNFSKQEIPLLSRGAAGVMGMKLEEKDFVLTASLSNVKGSITLISENGYAKKLPIGELTTMARYRKGQNSFFFTDKAKKLVYAKYDEVSSTVVLAKGEKLFFVSARSISFDNRTSKGKQIKASKIDTAFNWEV
ncbi:MAG: DNA gyrase/topoisomerase IV subunit A [Christensenellales bacterium]|jgi:DNA gyrase subunit A